MRPPERRVYDPVSPAVLTIPLLPVSSFLSLAHRGRNEVEEKTGGQSLLPAILDEIASGPVKEAFLLAAPRFYERVVSEKSDSHVLTEEDLLMCLRFLAQLSISSVPGQLMAGVAGCSLGAYSELEIGGLSQHTTESLLAPQVAMTMARDVERRSLPEDAILYKNQSLARMADRLVIWDPTEGSEGKFVSIGASSAASYALEAAGGGVRFGSLLSSLSEAMAAPRDVVSKAIEELCARSFLTTDLRPPITSDDPCAATAAAFQCNGRAETATQLDALRAEVRQYDKRRLGDGATALTTLREHTHDLLGSGDPILVHLRTHVVNAVLSQDVCSEIERAAVAMLRLAPPPLSQSHLRVYRRAFRQRYGDSSIPVTDVLDASSGLGPPLSYTFPPPDQFPVDLDPDPEKPSTRPIYDVILEAAASGQRTILLDDEVLDRVETTGWREASPATLEAHAYVAASDDAAVDQGEFRVIMSHTLGCDPAGRWLGRFTRALEPDMRTLFADLIAQDRSGRPLVDLVYLPDPSNHQDLAVRPQFASYEVAFGVTPGVSEQRTLPLEDLHISLDGERFKVESKLMGCEVRVFSTGVTNTYRAPNALRFLDEIADETTIHMSPLFDGFKTGVRYLPRVQFGRSVLSPQRWFLRPEDIGTHDLATSTSTRDLVRDWRDTWKVPRYVVVVESQTWEASGSRTPIDLESNWFIDLLAMLVRSVPTGVTVEEMLPTPDEAWATSSGGRFLVHVSLLLRDRQMQ